MPWTRRSITRAGLIAATYAVITIALAPISYGPIQVRLSEALTLLPFYWGTPAAVGLWLGCIVANAYGGFGLLDIVGGCLITLVAGMLTARMPNLWLGALWPIVLNALGVGAILHYAAGFPYGPSAAYVGLGQLAAVLVVGMPLMRWLEGRGILHR
ncbi:MAG TPA: QueT transporter family protein [Bacillota bacterium]